MNTNKVDSPELTIEQLLTELFDEYTKKVKKYLKLAIKTVLTVLKLTIKTVYVQSRSGDINVKIVDVVNCN